MTDEDSIKVKSASERSLNKNVAFNNNLKTAISEIEKCIDERPTWGFYRFPVEDINKFNNDSPNWDFFNAIIGAFTSEQNKALLCLIVSHKSITICLYSSGNSSKYSIMSFRYVNESIPTRLPHSFKYSFFIRTPHLDIFDTILIF